MSYNTIEAYTRDVEKLLQYIATDNLSLRDVGRSTLHDFVCTLQDVGIGARSQARVISGIKSFFKFLKLEGYIAEDAADRLEMPQTGRHLPEVLTVDEIDAMLS